MHILNMHKNLKEKGWVQRSKWIYFHLTFRTIKIIVSEILKNTIMDFINISKGLILYETLFMLNLNNPYSKNFDPRPWKSIYYGL